MATSAHSPTPEPHRAPASSPPPTDPDAQRAWNPPVDLVETADRFVVRIDLPGVDPGDIDLELDRQALVVRAHRPRPDSGAGVVVERLERPFGAFHRRLSLPDSIDPERARATARAGVLEVVFPKRAPAPSRRIPVERD